MELPLSWFVKASAIWGECRNYRGELEWWLVDTLPRTRSLLQFKMVAARSKRTSNMYKRDNKNSLRPRKLFSGFEKRMQCAWGRRKGGEGGGGGGVQTIPSPENVLSMSDRLIDC